MNLKERLKELDTLEPLSLLPDGMYETMTLFKSHTDMVAEGESRRKIEIEKIKKELKDFG